MPGSALIGLLLAALASSCGGGGGGAGHTSSGTAGAIVNHPDPSIGSLRFVVDANSSGNSTNPRITGLFWGRLVKVRDQLGVLQHSDMVVGEDIRTDLVDFLVTNNAVTEDTTVTILHPYTPTQIVNGAETSPYQNAFKRLDQNLIPIEDKSLEPNELPPYSLLPRNAAVVVRFNDVLRDTTIANSTVKLLVGNPPQSPFDGRVIRDINHGALDSASGEFHTTRVIIDTSVSQLEAAATSPPLPVNTLGLPPSTTTALPNVAVRVPTRVDESSGQIAVLRNLSGHAISSTGSGSTDGNVPTNDVVRAMRSGGATNVTGDVNNGFLEDTVKPRIVGAQPAAIGTPSGGPTDFVIALTFQYPNCASALAIGDVVQQPGVFGEVTQTTLVPVGSTIAEVHYRVVFPVNGQFTAGPAQVSAVFDPVLHFGKEACFVRFPSISSPPALGVATDSPVILRFSEPMDPARVAPFDTMTITRVAGATTALDYVVGGVTPSSDLKEFRFVPVLPFKHTNPNEESYFLNLSSGPNGPVDLAGNPLAVALPQVVFKILSTAATQNNNGFALRFSSEDELFNDTREEIRGQFLRDTDRGVLKPRAVAHFAAVADRTIPVPSIMATFAQGVQTPLSSLGSKMQTLWRYCDVGFALLDENKFNVDVEGLAWAPVGGAAVADTYDRFEISLCHSKHLPDETVDANLLPAYPGSGLELSYAANVLDPTNDPQRVVHPRARGYIVNPADLFQSDTGTLMMPYPLNRGLLVKDFKYYTWRDTAVQTKGAPFDSPGAELPIVIRVLGLGTMAGVPYPTGNVPTVGLPLLMEYKCYPDDGALGLNSFDISLANLNSSRPNFRAFSTGGVSGTQTFIRDPDLQTMALGGFNPASMPPGAMTLGVDNSFYIGQMDLVIRVSRAHTIWFSTGAAGSVPNYSQPVIEPRASDLPTGTQIVLAYRGANTVTGNVLTDKNALDFYGEPSTTPSGGTVAYFNNDNRWKTSLTDLNGARFFQVRITFIANTETGLNPELSALGFAFRL